MKTNLDGADLSRRTLLAASALVVAGATSLGGSGSATAETDPIIVMCQRWRELERERGAAYEHAGQRMTELRQAGWKDADLRGDPEYVARWAKHDGLDAMAEALGREIRATPAQFLAGILAKLECWEVDSDPGPADKTDHGFAVSALRDARRLGSPADIAPTVNQPAEVRHG